MRVNYLKQPAVRESVTLSEVMSCNQNLPGQIEQIEKQSKRGILSTDNVGNANSFNLGGTHDSDRLNYLYGLLEALTELHRTHHSMESLLQTASRMVVNVLDLEHCSIGWLDENDMIIRIWTSYTREGAKINIARVLRAFSELVNSERPKSSNFAGQPCQFELDGDLLQGIEIISPLRVDKQIVGYVCGLKNEYADTDLLNAERSLFATLSQQISAAIEAHRMREKLDCPSIALALNPKEMESIVGLSPVEQPMLQPINNPEKLVKKIARRFFADLRRAGFETKQIMGVTNEILDSLLVVLNNAKSGQENCSSSSI